ncbi:MAG: hypothetical protein K8F91_05070, partial [Candidatus Obscuribacterales bacterium]|nr:hypothetical protein [Candidatus Obscuribacterales bacterium]
MSLKHYFWLPDKKPLVGRAWLGRGLTLLVVLSIVNIDSSAAAAGLDKEEKATLDTIERKYFDHTYGKEETETRLERLEKLVFGESKTGDEEARLKTLTAAVPAALSEPEPKAIAPPIGSGSNQDSQATDTTDGDDDTSTDYPRVDALEQIIMGKSYKGEHLKRRLEQLEIKVFGKARSNADFSERVDHLEGYAEKHYHKSISQLTDPRNLYNYNFPAQG